MVMDGESRLAYAYAFMQVDRKGLELDFYQDELIRTNAKFLCVLKARQIGWSFIIAMRGLIFANDPDRYKYTRQFISYNEEDAKEKIRYAREFYESIPNRFKKKIKHSTETMMEFYDRGGKSTSRLISIACRPPRGKSGDISFDEFAFYPANRARAIFTAGVNAIARGGRVEVGSTPLGTTGIFYDMSLGKGNFAGYARCVIPWWFSRVHCNEVARAVKEAPALSTEERVRKFGTERLVDLYETNFLEDFQQEQECCFIDSKGSYISLELIYENTPGMREGERERALESDEAGEELLEIKVATSGADLLGAYEQSARAYEQSARVNVNEQSANAQGARPRGGLFLGYDVARRRDAAVIYAIEERPDGLVESLAEIEMRNTPYEDQLNELRLIMSALPVVRCCVDQTGMGGPIAERLVREYGDRIEGVDFTGSNKELLAIAVRRGLEERRFLLPNKQSFHAQIHAIKRAPTLTGGFRYDAERDERGHADSFWAWALAYHALGRAASKGRGFWARKVAEGAAARESIAANNKSARGKSAQEILKNIQGRYK